MLSNSRDEFSFPILSIAEISSTLAELEISLSPEDLRKITSQKVIQVYEQLVSIFVPLNPVTQADPLMTDSLQLVSFHRKLVSICITAGVEEVTLKDLLNPTVKKTIVILSALVNFCKFREERLVLFEDCSRKTEDLIMKRSTMETRVNTMADKVNSIRLARAEQHSMVQELRVVTSQLAADLRELKKIQGILGGEMDALKVEKGVIVEKVFSNTYQIKNMTNSQTNNSFLITNIKQDCIRLQSRIVSDPAKLLQTISDMQASVKLDKRNVVMAERKLRELKARGEAMDVVEGDLLEGLKLLDEGGQVKQKYEEGKKGLEALRDGVEGKKRVMRDLELKSQYLVKQLARQVKQCGDKLARLMTHKSQREAANASKKEKLVLELEKYEKEYERVGKEGQETNLAIENLLEETRMTEKSVEEEVTNLTGSFARLIGEIGCYQRALQETMAEE